jgi:hypothetical protein
LNFGDLETLRTQYQEYLQSQDSSDSDNEAGKLNQAILFSLGIFNPDDLFKQKLSDQELEPYLSEKRLDLKKYFVFNLGQEVKIAPKITISLNDEEDKKDEREEENNQNNEQTNNSQIKLKGLPV